MPSTPSASRNDGEDKDTRILELHAQLHHSLQNTDEALEHLDTLAEEVLKWCGEAVSHFSQSTDNQEAVERWGERARLVRKLLDRAESSDATDRGVEGK